MFQFNARNTFYYLETLVIKWRSKNLWNAWIIRIIDIRFVSISSDQVPRWQAMMHLSILSWSSHFLGRKLLNTSTCSVWKCGRGIAISNGTGSCGWPAASALNACTVLKIISRNSFLLMWNVLISLKIYM